MNDPMLMQAMRRQRELTREAGQARLAARLRRSQPNAEHKAPAGTASGPSRPPRPGSWLATAIARLRPATAGRWQAQ
jgi:hypothetical protein